MVGVSSSALDFVLSTKIPLTYSIQINPHFSKYKYFDREHIENLKVT